MKSNKLTRKEAIEFLSITDKEFDNYFKSGKEFNGHKEKNRWMFNKSEISKWKTMRDSRIVSLSLKEYQECFEFALKMSYSGKATRGTGIRGVRSEVQMADDFILGILAEFGVKKFLNEKFNTDIKLDMEVHPEHITPQDFDGVKENGKYRQVKIGVAVKSSKWKSCWNIIPPVEYENKDRKSDVYLFVRVGLPSDHLFRILRNHSFFKKVNKFLDKNTKFNSIDALDEIPIWIAGYSNHKELDKVTEIPNQTFSGNPNYRYVKEVGKMRNKDSDWKKLIKKL
jgi:hypothetical protein